jgi:hypothetical protein
MGGILFSHSYALLAVPSSGPGRPGVGDAAPFSREK